MHWTVDLHLQSGPEENSSGYFPQDWCLLRDTQLATVRPVRGCQEAAEIWWRCDRQSIGYRRSLLGGMFEILWSSGCSLSFVARCD